MSKLQQIVTYLESEKLDVAVVSDPVTINYLTGFTVIHTNAKCSFFVLADQEPLLLFQLLRLNAQLALSLSQSLATWTLENP